MNALALTPLFLLCLLLHRTLSTPTYCIPTQPLTSSFCFNPPTITDFDLTRYTGKWYQIYTSGTATFVSTNRCVTANYTQLDSGAVGVLNCQTREGTERAQCVRGEATRRVGALPGQLDVSFSAEMPPGPYNVAAILGDAESGYEAAAVYSCVERNGAPKEGVYMLAKSPEKAKYVLNELYKHLKCVGYEINDAFVPSYHGKECSYFDEGDGFDDVQVMGPGQPRGEGV